MRIKWTVKSAGGTVDHSSSWEGFSLLVTNFPGSRTLMWEVRKGDQAWGGTEDRFEHTVRSLKEKCLEKARQLLSHT